MEGKKYGYPAGATNGDPVLLPYHKYLVAHSGRVHEGGGDPEDAGDVLLVGVDDVRLAHRRHLELGVAHVKHLQLIEDGWSAN